MILRIVKAKEASTLPFTAGVIALITAILLVSLMVSSISVERTDQQAIADASALAGANALSKSNQLIKILNFLIWARNAVIGVLYFAVTIATIASFGSAAGLFEIPHTFQEATNPFVEGARRTIDFTKQLAPFYAIGNSVAYAMVNNPEGDQFRYIGMAIPLPFEFTTPPPTAAEQKLMDQIEEKNRLLARDTPIMQAKWSKYHERKKELVALHGENADELKLDKSSTDGKLQSLYEDAKPITSSVGGNTSARNKWEGKLANLEAAKKDHFTAGKDGLVAIVVHRDEDVKFSSFLSGRRTGLNAAISAANSVESDNPFDTIGEEAIRNIFSKIGLAPVGGALTWMLDAVNIVGQKLDNLGEDYGFLAGLLSKALKKLGVTPPSITEERPALINTEKATSHTFIGKIRSYVDNVNEAIGKVRDVEKTFKVNILPKDFSFE